jgi:hypothetical protein
MSSSKVIQQVNVDGSIAFDFDQTLSVAEILKLYQSLFGPKVSGDGHQVLIGGKIGLLTANITYLGGYWESYKKRWQLKSYYPEYVEKNGLHHIKTLYVGIYSYKDTLLFVVNDPVSHVGKKIHNSSAHIHVFDLQYALKNGSYRKVDHGGNLLIVMTKENFVSYINGILAGTVDTTSAYYDTILGYLDDFFGSLKTKWYGIDCYKEMAAAKDKNTKQNEWCGFYPEFLFKKYLHDHPTSDVEWCSDKKSTGIDLDLKFPKIEWFYGDLKCDREGSDLLGNDQKTLTAVITDHHGKVWYVSLRFTAEKDSEHDYVVTKYWDQLRGGKYAKRGITNMADGFGDRMKYSIKLTKAQVLNIDSSAYEILKLHPFTQGKNSDNKPRDPKIKINDEVAEAICIYSKSF